MSSDLENLQNAKDHNNEFLRLGQQIQLASPYFNFMNQNLDWYLDAYNTLPNPQAEALLKPLGATLATIQSLNSTNFEFGNVTGSTAMLLTANTSAVLAIKGTPSEYHHLIKKIDSIAANEKLIDDILQKLNLINVEIAKEFNEVKESYEHWKAKLKSNSDLAKDIRTFQEHFEGILNKLRVPKNEWGKVKIPSMSWKKMVEEIGKKGSEQKKSFLQQQKIGEQIWNRLTPILKKTDTISENEMETIFKRYIEHVFSILNLIDPRFFC